MSPTEREICWAFSENLKRLMFEHDINQPELARRTGAAAGTVNNWVSGVNVPRTGMLNRLTQIFDCRLSDLLVDPLAPDIDNVSPDDALPDAAYRAGYLYNKASVRDQHLIDTILAPYDEGTVPPRAPRSAPALRLAPSAKEDFAMDTLDVYDQPSAAGFGNYLDAPIAQREQYPPGTIPKGTTFGILISGDSMEPKIKDGATAFVQSASAIRAGEIGIFTLNGQAYCKQLLVDEEQREVRLRSINPAYQDILIRESDDLRTVGRVLGSYSV